MDDSAVYNQLISHMRNPLFLIPIQSFIEENCYNFVCDVNDTEEYKKVHKEYGTMVTFLLDSFRVDLGLTHKQLIKTLKGDEDRRRKSPDVEGIEYVLAVEDYSLFVHIMQKANLEIQEQALIFFMGCAGGSASNMVGFDDKINNDPILAIIIRQSKEEYDEQMARMSRAEEDFLKALKLSKSEAKEVEKEDRRREKILQMEMEKLAMHDYEVDRRSETGNAERKTHETQSLGVTTKQLGGIRAPRNSRYEEQNSDYNKNNNNNNNLVRDNTFLGDGTAGNSVMLDKVAENLRQLSPEELKEKQAFLRRQRDILVARKQEERERVLHNEEQRSSRDRPQSARVAKKIVAGANFQKPVPSAEDDAKIALRFAIAERLKAEVVKK